MCSKHWILGWYISKCMVKSLFPSTLARFLSLFSKWQWWSILWEPSACRRTYSFYPPYHVFFWTNIFVFSSLNLSAHQQITSYFLWMMLKCSQCDFLKSTTFRLSICPDPWEHHRITVVWSADHRNPLLVYLFSSSLFLREKASK